jgi:hypothetical protein
MYQYEGLPPESCDPCKERKASQFQRVREIVKDSPGITALEVHQQTDVPLSAIVKYIEAGMLEVASVNESADKLDNVDLQVWINKTTEKSKKIKAEKSKAEIEPPDDLPEAPKSRKSQMKFIVK